ncbi:sodium:solute symporter family protein [bacterium]|nr:sodium:solute symporter family protein [bacterium]
MTLLDNIIFAVYLAGVMAVGVYHFRRNENLDDYYVGSRSMGWSHVGMSVVATDVGGGFSIGLGGLGFAMGLSGAWLLFTGLVGAWLTAVILIPRVKGLDRELALFTFPDLLRWRYGDRTALIAAVISGIGYLGFTGGQILAGAKLASATVFRTAPFGMDPLQFALYAIAGITITYTVVGGLKAVIYTDTVQWMILLGGLLFLAIPVGLHDVGGWAAMKQTLPAAHFDPFHISPILIVNWAVTIIPIWFVGMTLYQRIYACKDVREARKAWYLAGLLEYPLMAFSGVILGMASRVLFPDVDPEMGLPLLIADVLPAGVAGLVIAAYFSAIMSTADSCLMASSGNFVNDLAARLLPWASGDRAQMRLSMLVTALVGLSAVLLASRFQSVLDAILYAYAFMVSGLFIPTLGVFYLRRGGPAAAIASMLAGGTTALVLIIGGWSLPWDLDAACFALPLSLLVFLVVGRFEAAPET